MRVEIGSHSPEPTNSTSDLVNNFSSRKSNSNDTNRFLDRELSDVFQNYVGEELCLQNFPYTRRYNQPLFKSMKEIHYIETLIHQESEPKSQAVKSGLGKNFSKIILVDDEESPPPTNSRRQSYFYSPATANKNRQDNKTIAALTARLDELDSR